MCKEIVASQTNRCCEGASLRLRRRIPLLIISGAAAGLITAVESMFSRPLRKNCLTCRARNVLATSGVDAHDGVRDAYRAIFDVDELIEPGTPPGPGLVAAAQHRIDARCKPVVRLVLARPGAPASPPMNSKAVRVAGHQPHFLTLSAGGGWIARRRSPVRATRGF